MLLVALALLPNTFTLSARVVDSGSAPLPGATVEVDGHAATVSDEHGRFEVRVAAGARLRVSLDRFEPYESVVEPGGTRVDIVLGPAEAGHHDPEVPPRFEDRVSVTARAAVPAVESAFARQPIDAIALPARRRICFARCRRFQASSPRMNRQACSCVGET